MTLRQIVAYHEKSHDPCLPRMKEDQRSSLQLSLYEMKGFQVFIYKGETAPTVRI